MRVLLADDDPHVQSAVRLLLAEEPGLQLVADCATASGLAVAVACSRPDVILLDWDLPDLRSGGELDQLRIAAPYCHVVAMSGRPEQRKSALRAGAIDFVCKGDAPDALLSVLRQLVSLAPLENILSNLQV